MYCPCLHTSLVFHPQSWQVIWVHLYRVALLPSYSPFRLYPVVQSSWMSASTKVSVTPLNKPKTGVSSTTAAGDKIDLRKFADIAPRVQRWHPWNFCRKSIKVILLAWPNDYQSQLSTSLPEWPVTWKQKGQHFPTLTDFVGFLINLASIANHPVSGRFQQFNYNNNSKKKKTTTKWEMDIPKYIININDGGKPPPKPPLKRGKVKENSCRYCGQAHPRYRC